MGVAFNTEIEKRGEENGRIRERYEEQGTKEEKDGYRNRY